MGRIAKLLSFFRGTKNGANVSEAKINPGGGDLILSEHFSSSGDDSHPLPNDYVATVKVQRTGGEVVVGYIDPKNAQKTSAGEKRVYARDGSGESTVELHLFSNGNAVLQNNLGTIIKLNGANVEVEAVAINITGNTNIDGLLTVTGNIIGEAKGLFTGNVESLGSGLFTGAVAASSFTGLGGSAMSTNVNISTSADVIAAGTSLSGHTHLYTWTDGAGSGTTGAPL